MRRVNLIIDEEELDLKDDTIITLSRQVNNIAELVDRQADYSNQFNIPKTAKNVRLLNKNRYKKVPASIVQYGATTRGFLVIASEDTEYKCQFYAGAINFFNLVEGLKLRDLDFSDVHHTNNSTEQTASQNHTWEDGYIYPTLNTTEDNSAYHPTNVGSYLPDAKIPCMFVRYILKKIVEYVEWQVDGIALSKEKVLRAVIPVNINNGDAGTLYSKLQTNNSHYSVSMGVNNIAMSIIYPFPNRSSVFNNYALPNDWGLGCTQATSPYIMLPYNVTLLDGALQIGTDGLSWHCSYLMPTNNIGAVYPPSVTKTHIAKCDTLFDVNINITFVQNAGNGLFKELNNPYSQANLLCYLNNTTQMSSITKIRLVAYGSAGTRTHSTPFRSIKTWNYGGNYTNTSVQLTAQDLLIYKNERLGVIMETNNSQVNTFDTWGTYPNVVQVRGITISDSIVEVYNTRVSGDVSYPAIYNGRYDLAKSMPDITIKDFLKALAQYFCWIYDADEKTQTLNVIGFNDVYNNIPYAYDWSNKIDARQESKKYHSDYCQINDMKFSEDTAPKGYGDSNFQINDTALKPRKTAIQVAFASTYFVQRWNRNMLHLPVWGQTYVAGFFVNKFKPRIFGVYFDSATFSATAFFENIVNIPYPFDYTMTNMVYDDYSALVRALGKYEFIEESVYLTAQDFLGFNHYIPVYIAKHQAYFYVNKITNFKEGTLTKVELLKLI